MSFNSIFAKLKIPTVKMIFLTLFFLMSLTLPTLSKEVYYELNISYFDGAPDGVPKRVLGFNNQFPGPTIRAERYDILTINVTNSIQDGQTTTIHWHGFEQFLTPWQDGPRMLAQCDITPGASYVYSFQVNQTGTYWYHAHHTSQYGEGLWGVIIIDNTPEVYNYDGEFVITLSDWFHLPAHDMSEWYQNTSVSKGGMPFPDSGLINGAGYYPCEYANLKNKSCNPSFATTYKMFEVEKGKTYRFRVVNPATIVLYVLSIDGHKLETIETDGVDTIRVPPVDRVTISTGTRYSFLVKMDGELDQYWIRSWADLSTFKRDYPNVNPYPEAQLDNPWVLAVLKYKDSLTTPINEIKPSVNPLAIQGRLEKHDAKLFERVLSGETLMIKSLSTERVDGFTYYAPDPLILPKARPPYPTTTMENAENVTLNYMDCAPFGGEQAPDYVNESIILYIPDIDNPSNTFKPGFNNITYDIRTLDKPGLVKMLYDETLPESVHPIELNGFGEDYVVELILNDYGDSGHPFHLHGHTFWVMGYGDLHEGPFVEERDRAKLRSGVRKETMAVLFDSWVVLRFRADNPGLWLLHCHMNFHFEAAIGLVFLSGKAEAKHLFKKSIPQQTADLCKLSGMAWGEVEASTPSSEPCTNNVSIMTFILSLIALIAQKF